MMKKIIVFIVIVFTSSAFSQEGALLDDLDLPLMEGLVENREAALLFESESYKALHKVIVVTSPIETRIERIIKRDHVKREDILKRIQNQTTDRERMSMADWVIYNDGVNSLIEQTLEVHQTILKVREQGVVPFKF